MPSLTVIVVGMWLLWPIPAGRMPLSADHTVHITRVWMWAQELQQGHLRGWSPVWFLGTPIGELYPVLGDLVIIIVRTVSAGLLSWADSYAIGFTIVFLVQGLALLRAGRASGMGAAPGLIAALLLLLDAGEYREGGWIYTVEYGVWPQALATALTWLAFAELATALAADHCETRSLALGGLWLGLSFLAHPMSLMTAAFGVPILVLGSWSRHTVPARIVLRAAVGSTLALGVAAWWLVPMMSHSPWMASYGWLWRPLRWMAGEALHGRFALNMPPAVGACIHGGIVATALFGPKIARTLVAVALVLWLMASQDAFWTLRLDRLSDGFGHVQYQRFVIAAKPGLFLAAGMFFAILGRAFGRIWRSSWDRRVRMLAVTGISLLTMSAALWTVIDVRRAIAEHGVGEPRLERFPDDPEREQDYERLLQWASDRWAERDTFWRFAVQASNRNSHWFMDAPVRTGAPLYKAGFTPGDNFVHKPESLRSEVLDALGARWLISAGARVSSAGAVRFGPFVARHRSEADDWQPAVLTGPGSLEILEHDPFAPRVRVRVSGAAEGSELVFRIAGYPRWRLDCNDTPVLWYEKPIWGNGPIATIQERRSGALRGGKALGDDGSEPTLIAIRPGDGTCTLEYRRWTSTDVSAFIASLTALAAIIALGRPRGAITITAIETRIEKRLPRWVLVTLGVATAFVAVGRWAMTARSEGSSAVTWLDRNQVSETRGVRAGPLKTDMVIRPAVVVQPSEAEPATVVFPRVELGPTLRGWSAIDDDAAKQRVRGSHTMTIEARNEGGSWILLDERPIRHRPGRMDLEIPTGALAGRVVDLRLTIVSRGTAPPLGFDFDLGVEP